MKRISRKNLEKLAYVARENGDNEAFQRAIEMWRICCVTLKKAIVLDEEESKLLEPYKAGIKDYDWTDFPLMEKDF